MILWTLNLDGPQAQPSTALLLHFDGANGSTTFVDSSTFARSMALTGAPTISTAQSRFGGASGAFASGQSISTPANAIALLADFCIEGWVRFNSVSGAQYFLSSSTQSPLVWIEHGGNSPLNLGAYILGQYITATFPTAANQWYHIAVTRSGDTCRFFVDGQLQGSFTSSASKAADSWWFGTAAPGVANAGLNGLLDEWRIVTGQAVYTANFTPPTAPFPDPGGINGQGTNTVGAFVQVGQGSVGSAAVTGFGAATLSSFEQVAVGTALVAGGGAAALSAFTQSAAGTVRASGAGANTLGVFTQAGAGLVSGGAVVGSGANTLGAFSQSATAGVRIQGASARTLGAFTQSASGTVALPAIQGAGASAMGAFSSVGAGALWVSGVGSTGLNGFSTESQGELRVAGAGVSVLSAFVSQGGAMTYAPQGGEPTGVVLVPAHAVSMRVQGHAQPMSQGKHAVTANR